MERYFLIGTAGHVDHGKTQLIHALTGISTDRLKEEKERGISIELGFAFLTLPDGTKTGIVDVPGHEKFVRQMLAGASGMDVVLLVIAADEGFMPQTKEHLDILNILQIHQGIVVLTKIDMVDKEWLEMIEQETRDRLKNTFLKDAPLCKVSSVTYEGITELAQTILDILVTAESKQTDRPARMPIDRVFSIRGFGTVVTGTMNSGIFKKGQDVRVEPGGQAAKIRNIQVHGEQTLQALAGQRAAINLGGLSVCDVKKGSNLVIPGFFGIGQLIDVKITSLLEEQKVIKQRQRIHFHIGTAETIGRIHLLEQEELAPGETGFAQIMLEEPVLAVAGDRFVLRYYSPVTTIGGGTVLGFASFKKKRFKDKVIEEFQIKAEGSSLEKLKKEMDYPISLQELIIISSLSESEVEQTLHSLQESHEVINLTEDTANLFWRKEAAEEWGAKASAEVKKYQDQYPLSGGIGREELKKRMKITVPLKSWQLILEWGALNGFLQVTGNQVEALPKVRIPENIQKQLEALVEVWEKAGLSPQGLEIGAAAKGISAERALELAGYFVIKGRWLHIGEYYFSKNAIEKAKSMLEGFLKEKKQITVSEARDLWQTSRKYALPLLEYFDSVRFTKREGDIRGLYN